MRYRTLGNSGLLVSVVGLGCNNFGGRIDRQRTRAVVDAAIDAGITLFDTAEMYGKDGGSELALGEVLAGRGDKVVLATKFGHQKVDMGYGPAAGARRQRSRSSPTPPPASGSRPRRNSPSSTRSRRRPPGSSSRQTAGSAGR